jgi:hypothetical protein
MIEVPLKSDIDVQPTHLRVTLKIFGDSDILSLAKKVALNISNIRLGCTKWAVSNALAYCV